MIELLKKFDIGKPYILTPKQQKEWLSHAGLKHYKFFKIDLDLDRDENFLCTFLQNSYDISIEVAIKNLRIENGWGTGIIETIFLQVAIDDLRAAENWILKEYGTELTYEGITIKENLLETWIYKTHKNFSPFLNILRTTSEFIQKPKF